MKTELHYVVINGGDGSAYPLFVESKELAEWIEEHENEGFTEASGWIILKSNSPIDFDGGEWPYFSQEKINNFIGVFFS